MLITCWSSKGGSGTTVVAAALAAVLAAEAGAALLADLAGDLPAALGLPEPAAGLSGWSGDEPAGSGGRAQPAGSGGRAQPAGSGGTGKGGGLGGWPGLDSLAVEAGGGVWLLPRGRGPLDAGMGAPLAAALSGRPAVVDAGVVERGRGPGLDLAAAATASLLVLRPCFLALRRAVAAPIRGSGVVLVDEPQRVLGAGDIEAALGIPVLAVLPWDPAVARRVDAGLLGSAVPRSLSRPLRRLVGPQTSFTAEAPANRGASDERPEAVA